ncbi:MAG: hypothetical protein ACLSVG_04115 [Clostridia bacterium]
MEQYVINRITYAASYEFLKRFVRKNKLNMKQLEDISIVMADYQVCDPILLHHCGNPDNPYNGDNSKMRKGTGKNDEQNSSDHQSKQSVCQGCIARCGILPSTDSEDQVNSFIAQMHYYYSFIHQAENMTLVDIYADDSVSGRLNPMNTISLGFGGFPAKASVVFRRFTVLQGNVCGFFV